MTPSNNGNKDVPDEFSAYDIMQDLEDMESLLEQLIEAGVEEDFDPTMLPPDTAELAREARVNSVAELRALIDARHRALDDE